MRRPIPMPVAPPPLRVPRPLPRRRFVPGMGPHPKHCGEGGAGLTKEDPPELAWLRGMDLLAHRYPWEAHEAFEQAWLAWRGGEHAVRGTAAAGLAKISAAWLRHHLGDPRAAARLVQRAHEQIEPLHDVSLDRLVEQTRAFVRGGAWPDWPGPTWDRSSS